MVEETLDGTQVVEDVKTSPPAEETSKSYTEEQVAQERAKAEQKARSDALADLGRLKKTNETLMSRLDKMQADQRQAELEANQDDPVALARIKAEQRAADAEAKLAEREPELNAYREKVATYEKSLAEATRGQTITEVAKRLEVDPEKLTEASKFTDGSATAIEGMAAFLPKATKKTPLRPDSNRSVGGGMSDDAIRQAYIANPTDPTIRPLYHEMRRRLGK